MSDAEFNKVRLRKLKILSEYYAEDTRRREKLAADLAEADQEMAALADGSLDLPCLVRITPGPKQTVYHSADAPCGRVRDRDNYREYSEYEALEEVEEVDYYLERCTACDWDKAAKDHAQRGSA
ncbi:hypothetical protein OG783_29020 [Streptomyces jietaisiensis]|uniref:hypothetical protein n=1 Tax=Streptomyces griseoaurantiacus TaxID=68213 RepID=UPI0032540FFE